MRGVLSRVRAANRGIGALHGPGAHLQPVARVRSLSPGQ